MSHYGNDIMLLYVYLCMQTCLVYVCVNLGIYVIDIHMQEATYVFMQADMHEYVCFYVYRQICINLYLCMYICMCVCMQPIGGYVCRCVCR